MVLNVYKQLSIVKPPAERPAGAAGDRRHRHGRARLQRPSHAPASTRRVQVRVGPARATARAERPGESPRPRRHPGHRAPARTARGAALDRTNHSALVLVMPILRIPSCTVFLKINTHGECSRTRCEPHTLCCHCSAIPTVTGNAEVRGPYDHHRVQVKRA